MQEMASGLKEIAEGSTEPAPAPIVPPKEWHASLRSLSKRQRTGRPSEWRNSLVAIDDRSGEVLGVVAHGVVLFPSAKSSSPTSSDDDASSEAVTPPTLLEYDAAHQYKDFDVRPPSRATSVLGEETFAPPPIPDKPDFLRALERRSSHASLSERAEREEEEDDDDEVEDGHVKVYAKHAEAHRPDLLRDSRAEEEYDSDASGSTIGGPALQLWRKARGGKEGEVRRKAKKEERARLRAEQKQQKHLKIQTLIIPAVQVAAEELHNPTVMESRDGTEDGEENIELGTKQANKWYIATKRSAMSRHLPGNSVLIEFLAGSRIGASLIRGASPYAPPSRTSASLKGPDAFSPTQVASIPQTGAMAYIPVLPSHLLWFFGFDSNASATPQGEPCQGQDQDKSAAILGPVAVMGEDLMAIASAFSPSSLMQMAVDAATSAVVSVTDYASSAYAWVGYGLSHLSLYGPPEEEGLDVEQPGDADAEEWEWAIPSFDTTTLENTPRPIYRRKKLVPSAEGNFQPSRHDATEKPADSESDLNRRFSIVHFDQWGVARRAVTKHQGFAI